MKKIAWFLLVLFATVQVVPGLRSFFNDSRVVVFNIDEEKSTEKSVSEELKEKKDYTSYQSLVSLCTQKLNTAFHIADDILQAPCIEKHNPPPNFI
ncbi:MAG: hypothetical protein JNN00_05550 [Chitinophagaceae bacterium]|nr:hypothetical protein [Chitinophagaceae bacterium]